MTQTVDDSQIYWARHAESFGTDPTYFDVPGPGLSATGSEQAAALAGWFRSSLNAGVGDIIVSSPMRRARETARAVSEVLGCQVILDERIAEFQPAESRSSLRTRASDFSSTLSPNVIVVVSHGATIEACLESLGFASWDSRTQFGNPLPPGGLVRTVQRSTSDLLVELLDYGRPVCGEELLHAVD